MNRSHRLSASQYIPRPIEDVFAFFAEPRNLARLTPPSMRFEFKSDDWLMRPGVEIEYRLRPLFGIPVSWQSRIEAFDPPRGFRDVQVHGPYRSWTHRHTFQALEGGTLVNDEVTYELPFGPLGDLAHRLAVRSELESIFRFRARALEAIFESPDLPPTGRTVAVAGGTGLVGGAIARELHRRGDRVVVLSHHGEAGRGQLPDDVEIRAADVTDAASLGPALAGADALVIALAFRNSPIESPRRGETFERIDAGGTERLVAAARAAGVERVV
jgi:ligand-binding SRPBCC domain-containing protein